MRKICPKCRIEEEYSNILSLDIISELCEKCKEEEK